jgi:hypothetical protein
MIAFFICLASIAAGKYEHPANFYKGEAYLTAERTLNDMWFEVAGDLSRNVWTGFLSGLYDRDSKEFSCQT